MANDHLPVSRWCVAALALGLIALLCGLAAVIGFVPDLIVFYVAFGVGALLTAVVGLTRVGRHPNLLRGRKQAWRGLSLPTVFFVLASYLMPAT
jgi:hypothetical protein